MSVPLVALTQLCQVVKSSKTPTYQGKQHHNNESNFKQLLSTARETLPNSHRHGKMRCNDQENVPQSLSMGDVLFRLSFVTPTVAAILDDGVPVCFSRR